MVTPDSGPPSERGIRGHLRELIGTVVGLAVLVIAGAGIVWWTNGTPSHSRRAHVTAPLTSRSAKVAPPGVPDGAQRMTVAFARDGNTLVANAGAGGWPVPTTDAVVIHLLGIDAPNLPNQRATAQCFAQDSVQALRGLVPSGTAIWVKPDVQLRDVSAQYLLYVWNSQGMFVNVTMAQRGFVRALATQPDLAYQATIADAVAAARAARRGLWARCG